MLYVRAGQAYVMPQSETVDGLFVANGPCKVVDAEDGSRLANQVEKALGQSRSAVPTPPREANLVRELLDAAGVPSYAAFTRGDTRAVSIHATDGAITITPMHNRSPKPGFEYLVDQAIQVEHAAGLADALLQVLVHRGGGSG